MRVGDLPRVSGLRTVRFQSNIARVAAICESTATATVQALELELQQLEQKAAALAAQGADLVSDGHFDAPAIERESQALRKAARALQHPAAARRRALHSSLQ